MNKFNFTNKIVTTENNIINTTKLKPINEKISLDLYNSFSNLNFSGVYRIGSETIKNECFIGSAYNITLKITHHLHLLINKKHYSDKLQEWVNKNGIENIDISVLAWTPSKPDLFEAKEQYFVNLIKPKFNTVLNKYKITISEVSINYPISFVKNSKNEFGNNIVSSYINQPHIRIKVEKSANQLEDENRKKWKPTILVFDEQGETSFVQRGDVTNIKVKKTDVTIKESIVYRKGVF